MKALQFRWLWMIAPMAILVGVILAAIATGSTVQLAPTHDTFVDQVLPNTLYGSQSYLIVRRGGNRLRVECLAEV